MEKEIENLRESLRYTNAFRIIESEGTGKAFEVVLIEQGFSKNLHPHNGLPIEYGEELLSNAETLKKFEGVSLFAYEFKGDQDMLFEHLPDAARAKAEGGVILNKVGFAEGVRYGEFQKPDGSIGHGVIAKARFVNDKLREMLRNAWEMGKKDIVGFSIDAVARMKEVISDAGARFNRVLEFVELPEVTIVDEPGAGGILVRMLASATNKTKLTESKMNEKLLALLRQFAPHLVESITDDLAEDVRSTKLAEILDGDPVKKFLSGLAEQKAKDGGEKLPDKVEENPASTPAPALTADQITAMIAQASAKAVENALSNRNNAASKLAASRESLQGKLKESNLPKAMQDEITLEHYDSVLTDEQINKLIARRQNTIAALKETGLFVPGQEIGVTISKDQEDKWSDGLVAMLVGRPENGTPGFYSLHESFRVITGLNGSAEYLGERLYNDIAHCVTPRPQLIPQSAWRGQLRESRMATIGRIKEASLATTTWAEVFGDSIRRAMIKFYQEADWTTWRMIVSEISSASDYRTMRRVRIGGLADLADVAELGTYQEISIPGDEEETFAVGKKGNLFSYSEEAAKNDDLGALRRIPMSIGRSAARTLYKSVFDVLRSNPTMGDGTALFHANHGNLGSTAFDSATLFAAITAMRDQTELSSSEVLGNASPKYIVYPNELEKTVWEQARAAMSSASGARGETVDNFFLTFNLTAVPPVGYWTDTNNWYLLGDPAVCPTIEVAFLNGRQEPEILIQDQAQLGSVFTADKITFKGRLIYGVKALDHRFMYGAVVA